MYLDYFPGNNVVTVQRKESHIVGNIPKPPVHCILLYLFILGICQPYLDGFDFYHAFSIGWFS